MILYGSHKMTDSANVIAAGGRKTVFKKIQHSYPIQIWHCCKMWVNNRRWSYCGGFAYTQAIKTKQKTYMSVLFFYGLLLH